MFDPKKNDMIDTIFTRYKDSFKLLENTDGKVPVKDRDSFCACLRRNMCKDFKRIDREYRWEKLREWWSRRWWVKLWRKVFRKRESITNPEPPTDEPAANAPDTATPPNNHAEPTSDTEPPTDESAVAASDTELPTDNPAELALDIGLIADLP